MLSNQAASGLPVGERVEIETQQAGLRPSSSNHDGFFAMGLAGTQRFDERTDAGITKPIARERESLNRNLTEAAVAGDILQLRHLGA